MDSEQSFGAQSKECNGLIENENPVRKDWIFCYMGRGSFQKRELLAGKLKNVPMQKMVWEKLTFPGLYF